MERPPVSYTAGRIAMTTAVISLFINAFEVGVTYLRADINQGRPQDLSLTGRTLRHTYDFIVVGGGSAGAVVASRLSEISDWNVLLLEAGGPEPPLSDIPFGFGTLQKGATAWERYSEPNDNFCQAMERKKCYLHSGKVLGGTSTINGMVYVRGNRRDYDNWAALGNTGWDYNNVLQYFKKSEDMRLGRLKSDTIYHSTGGYLTIDEMKYRTPLGQVLLDAGLELGYDIIDHNGETQHGFTRMYNTVRDGLRCNTAKAFLQPAKDRPNLDISLNSEVEQVLIDPNTTQAYGVVLNKQGKRYTVYNNKEVIVSAGAFNSPKLLMLSGVGPAEHLKDIGISPIISDLPVGRNLQDHIGLGGLVYLINKPLGGVLQRLLTIDNFLNFFTNTDGPLMGTGFAETCAFLNTKYSEDTEWPDIGLYFNGGPENTDGGPSAKGVLGLTDEFYNAVFEPILYKDSYEVIGVVMRPKSRGVVLLRGKDPALPPVVHPNYLSDENDVKVVIEAAKFGLLLSNTTTMRQYGATLNPHPFPGCVHLPLMSDSYIECAVRQHTMSLWHHSGTCKMGPDWDPDAVVNPRLQVRGVKGMRVADASIIPVIPSANTNPAAIMIGEKASDFIKEDWGVFVK